VSLLAEETVFSFETENMQSDSESQRDTEMERKQKGRDNVCVCVCVRARVCGLLLRMPTCANDISVLHLIAGADGSIKATCAVPPPFIPVCSA